MADKTLLIGVFLLNAAATLLSLLPARLHGHRLGAGRLLFGFLLPVAGAIVCWLFACCPAPSDDVLAEFKRNTEAHREIISSARVAQRTVPLEEAFLINTPQKRRELMMNLLRSDPRKYLDLLLLARFNDDPETAHYATATLTEVQRQMQLELQQLQIEADKNPDDNDAAVAYVKQLHTYVDSGLLEGRLLERQRMILEQAMDHLTQEATTRELYTARIGNLLALEQAAEARECAENMIARWPDEETGWLELLRVCVETHDSQGLASLKKRIAETSVAWTHAGLEHMRYFIDKSGSATAQAKAGAVV